MLECGKILQKSDKGYISTLENTIKSLKEQLKQLLIKDESEEYQSDLTIKKGEIYKEF